ncbi:hypothetical protein BBO99_00003101 [Phytophthora kernoviae]|uniref:Peptidase S1 domain-containing protein n=2 Tax=Phytophthora kernoviae TaxID=325452 RepID=A0A3R7J9K2_9STRA|nr:hypothetical protein G195_003236 [Phytophthora kernoviae 00238/432]KAG2528898.1 hypothetical protein JM16_000945 [Phytophthora kernoviae]KAG2530226.1 hypothetical protein JM18_001026 [Phytophthora kernoviae]RLN44200.1 hypothetical protein BBI17_002966 [Phytophthora kernoviae]RLN82171.1 hypothetical protein BBO99_00003101 [Phytophthora kernoviae]
MRLILACAQASTLVALAQGYSFSEITTTTTAPVPDSRVESTGLAINEESRIFGGSETSINKFPSVVGLRFQTPGATNFCGGVLVAPQYVLTAAHCILEPEEIYASIGSQYGSGINDGEQILVVKRFLHPLYNNATLTYDVGLLKLETPSTQQTATLCAADGSDNDVGTVATILGWGKTEDGTFSRMLQSVDVKIITNEECKVQYVNYVDQDITEEKMCAGTEKGKDACRGDSGGPLFANGVLVGIISSGGVECAANSGVYVRISHVLDTIDSIINSNGMCNQDYSGTITEGMLCAETGNGKDSCQRDSEGSPVINNELVGIISSGSYV